MVSPVDGADIDVIVVPWCEASVVFLASRFAQLVAETVAPAETAANVVDCP